MLRYDATDSEAPAAIAKDLVLNVHSDRMRTERQLNEHLRVLTEDVPLALVRHATV